MVVAPPELTTFGSLIRFALQMEGDASSFYEAVAAQAAGGTRDLFRELTGQHADRRRLLERTRQQTLNEMVLEPITGLDGARYVYEAAPPALSDAVRVARALEEVAARFYEESAAVAQSTLTEAARTLLRLAQEDRANGARLRAFA